ncbi:MAG: Crp/Fnr family transcriptional regulator [Leptolyngbyaceae cyanobacterium]
MESLDSYIQTLDQLFEQRLIDARPTLLTLKPGETVFQAEASATHIFGVKAGKIQLIRYLENGQMIHQYAVHSDAWFGENALLGTTYQNCAIAAQPSEVVSIPAEAFITLLRHRRDMPLVFIEQLVGQLHVAKNLITLRSIRSASERVLAYLNSVSAPEQRTYVLESSIKEMAEHISLAPEVVSRSLRKLQDEGIIRRSQRKITFLRR